MKEPAENMAQKRVTYTVEHEGKVYVVKNVPARENDVTGERFFSPETVEKLYRMVHADQKPDQMEEAPVFDYEQMNGTRVDIRT